MLDLKSKLKQIHNASAPYSELVPWMLMVNNHMIMNKDGSLMVCYTFSGSDVEGMQDAQSDQVADIVERAMRLFDERISLWWTVDRRRTFDYPDGEFEDPISEMVNEEWKKKFLKSGQYTNKHYLSIMFKKPDGVYGFMDKLEYYSTHAEYSMPKALTAAILSSFSNKDAYSHDQATLDALIVQFSEIVNNFETVSSSLSMYRLEDHDLLKFLHDRANPASYGQKVKAPEIPLYLDSYIPDNNLTVGKDVMLFSHAEEVFVAAASVKDWPNYTKPGLLDIVLSIPGELTMSQVFRYQEQEQAKSFAEKVRKNNLNASKKMITVLSEAITGKESNKVDEGRLMKARDADEALAGISGNNDLYGYYNLSFITYGNTKESCEQTLRLIMRKMGELGFLSIREKLHLLSAWAGTMPGQWAELVRWFFINTKNLADLAPLRTITSGSISNAYLTDQMSKPCSALTALPTEYHTPYYLNLHNGDLAHSFLVGPSRNGKSVFVNFLISQFRKYNPNKIFIFDKDYSARIPTLLQGGKHIDMTGANGLVKMNPFAKLDDKSSWKFLAEWVEILLTCRRGKGLTSEEMESVLKGIEKVHAGPKSHWRLMSLLPYLTMDLGSELKPWVGDGQLGKYFDNIDDDFTLGSFTAVEMGGLFNNPHLATAFMSYAFYRIQQELDGTPTVIYIEEAWFMLANEVFASKIEDWLKTLAKRVATLIMATQSLQELAESKIFSSIIDNIPNKIFLPNFNARAHEKLYKHKFGLNDVQIDRIQQAQPKRQYYIVSPTASRMLEASFPKEVLNVMRSDAKAQSIFMKHYQSGSGNWKENYLTEIGES